MEYAFASENFEETYPEFQPLYKQHYGEMAARLNTDGVRYGPYKPRVESYFRASREGYYLHFTVRHLGAAVGYCNVYLTNDMHNGDLISREDVLYILPEHRNGIGRKLVLYGLEQLRGRGVKRLSVSAMTDLRVVKLWKRMGFQEVATQMIYQF